jgi:hypothetical protein
MPRFLIQLSHRDEHEACVRALGALERYGSHFLTHADWGCKDGVHCGWLVADLEDRNAAMQLVPPEFRHEARIVQLNRFTREDIRALIAELESELKRPGAST